MSVVNDPAEFERIYDSVHVIKCSECGDEIADTEACESVEVAYEDFITHFRNEHPDVFYEDDD